MRQLIEQNLAKGVPQAKNKIEQKHDVVWDVLEQVVKNHPVLLNRAPTLHKLSIRSFEPVIIEGEAITLHPLVCSGYNADFDGDQMAVHVPLSREAQIEARVLLLANQNLLHPQNGESAVTPSQDMVLGCHYLSLESAGENGEGKVFSTENEAIVAYENGYVSLHARIVLMTEHHPKFPKGKYLVTTVGKILINQIIPNEIVYLNDSKFTYPEPEGSFETIEGVQEYIYKKTNHPMKKDFLKDIIGHVYNEVGGEKTGEMLDGMKDIGYKYATKGGLTISLYDIYVPDTKEQMIKDTEEEIKEIETIYNIGQISNNDRYEAVVTLWEATSKAVAKKSISELDKYEMNPIRMMMDSGARGTPGQYRQLAGMRGLMADPTGKTIERPIKANFKEGLSVFEFFISTHGARKGMADKMSAALAIV